VNWQNSDRCFGIRNLGRAIDSIDSRESLEKYLTLMRERCLGLWDLINPN
jgi:hypothetical protein